MRMISRGLVYREGAHILQPGDIVPVKYVTVIYGVGFAVYWGETDRSDEWIASFGDKADETTARCVAPYLAHLVYCA